MPRFRSRWTSSQSGCGRPDRFSGGPQLEKLDFAALEQPRFQGQPVQVIGQRPAQASSLGACEVALNGRRTDADALTDLTVAESLRGQAQDFHDPSHRYSPLWHVAPPSLKLDAPTRRLATCRLGLPRRHWLDPGRFCPGEAASAARAVRHKPKWVFGISRNDCSASSEIGVRLRPKLPFAILRNGCSFSPVIHNRRVRDRSWLESEAAEDHQDLRHDDRRSAGARRLAR